MVTDRKILVGIELSLFLVFSTVAVLPFFLVRFVPSLDGPQHLYTARIIHELLLGDEFMHTFFRLNPLPVGNLGSQYLMALLLFIFPAWIAEKIFLSLCLIGLALSFRYFIKSVSCHGSLIYLMIFPFGFTSLFMFGYYNFSLAFIPFFIALGYFNKLENRYLMRDVLILMMLCILIYFAHAIVFIFFLLIIFLQFIFEFSYPIIINNKQNDKLSSILKRYGFIAVSCFPALILLFLYFFSIYNENVEPVSFSLNKATGSLTDLYRLKILIGFHHGEEAGPNTLLFWILIALTIMVILSFFRFFRNIIKLEDSDTVPLEQKKWAFIVSVLLIVTLFIPDQLVTGSMSARFCVLFFFSLITLFSLQTFPRIIMISAIVLILASFSWHRVVIFKYYKGLNNEIAAMEQAGEHIQPGSVIYPVNCSDNWLHNHFHCYLGVDKPIVDMRMPQASPEMPVIWNFEKMPGVLLGELNQEQAGANWIRGNTTLEPVPADYFFIWKAQRMEEEPGVIPLLEKISPFYSPEYRTSDGSVLLYKENTARTPTQ